jgi:uncharacterized membrane protein
MRWKSVASVLFLGSIVAIRTVLTYFLNLEFKDMHK